MPTRIVALKLGTLLAVVTVAALAGGAVGYLLPSSHATPRVVRGTIVAVDATGDAIGFRAASEGPGEGGHGYAVDTAQWIDRDGHRRGDKPIDCVTPLSPRHREVELGIVDVDRVPVVVWVRCLD
ncbi:MAG TPA: hypothetical protein VF054_13065 [Micromonosporaceae bacterium]